jgi:hypothetical protein
MTDLACSECGRELPPEPGLDAARTALSLAARLEAVAPLLAHANLPAGLVLVLEQSLGTIETEMETLIALLCDYGPGPGWDDAGEMRIWRAGRPAVSGSTWPAWSASAADRPENAADRGALRP